MSSGIRDLVDIIHQTQNKRDEYADATTAALDEVMELLRDFRDRNDALSDNQGADVGEILQLFKVSSEWGDKRGRISLSVPCRCHPRVRVDLRLPCGQYFFTQPLSTIPLIIFQDGQYAETVKDASFGMYNAVNKVTKKIDAMFHPDISAVCRSIPWDDATIHRVILEVSIPVAQNCTIL